MALRFPARLNSVALFCRFVGFLACGAHSPGQGGLWDIVQKALGLGLGSGAGLCLTKGDGPDGPPFFIECSLAEAAVVFGQPAQGPGRKSGVQVFLGLPEHGQFGIHRID